MIDSNTPILIRGERFVPYLSADRVQARVAELAAALDRDYAGTRPVFVCVLSGAFLFFADLLRRVTLDAEVDFLKLASYRDEKSTSGRVHLEKDLSHDVAGRDLILVEDIVDTGVSVDFMKKLLATKNPASVKFVTLLHKPAATHIAHALDYVGFEIPPRFVVGYGLDYAGHARSLPSVYICDEGGPHDGATIPQAIT
jgi:hypoxanthine phosphoribosyltransferase